MPLRALLLSTAIPSVVQVSTPARLATPAAEVVEPKAHAVSRTKDRLKKAVVPRAGANSTGTEASVRNIVAADQAGAESERQPRDRFEAIRQRFAGTMGEGDTFPSPGMVRRESFRIHHRLVALLTLKISLWPYRHAASS